MLKCADIGPQNIELLMQCYCKTVYNTNYYEYNGRKETLVCTVGDNKNIVGNATEACANHEKYSSCPGINIRPNAGAHVTLSKVALLAVAFSSLLFM
ncbi:hypothetical protein FBU59_002643 [Linderina macrospora]|uniref:Uncharacterized protein n=1 Tax=Linderina macrospora TaxID=4868 RepID=A0ACC1JAR1_9FUNG|nr:hypothetical protein FBU59_002643 [Linderina macrospora]